MEKKLDFDAAKQKVAEMYGEKNWASVCLDISSPDWLYARAAEIMAQSWVSQAVQFKPLRDLIDNKADCEMIFKSVFRAPLAKMTSVYADEFSVQIEGDNGDMVPDYARLEVHYDGSVYCCVDIHGREIDQGPGDIFALVDLIRSLGYAPQKPIDQATPKEIARKRQ